ncbi:hypothetical protein BHE74_00025584 [Ensete ventricosum]|nr:hypothetical protein BHE74_00025584 [Ensete ventricosum]RZR82673.1 hypothetical protein BHM03_00009141 [Ensete ventricosum]
MRAARHGTLLRILLRCSSGMLLHWLLPSGLRWLLHIETPLSSSRWFLHSGRGLLLFSSCWFLSNSHHDLLLPFPEILGLGVASSWLQLVVQIFDWNFLL